MKVEAQSIDAKSKELLEDWSTKKPIGVRRLFQNICVNCASAAFVGRSETSRCHSTIGTVRNETERTVGETNDTEQGEAERQDAGIRCVAPECDFRTGEVFEFSLAGQVDHYEKRLRADLAELEEIRNVWKSLENVCNRLEELKDVQWITVQPKKLKTNLEELLSSMTAMVSSVKNYHSYNAVKTNIENYLKVRSLSPRCAPTVAASR